MPTNISTKVQKDNYKYHCKKTLGHNLSKISTKCLVIHSFLCFSNYFNNIY